MNIPALPPTASTTLVILLGASAWPNSPGFQASPAFVQAAQGFRDYVLDTQGFGLPKANLFDQFDAVSSASDQLEILGSFLEQRAQALKTANQEVRDVLVYFVGHGGFAGKSADFYLMSRRTNANSLRASGIAIDALAEVVLENARQTRRYVFLDCCFAAAAFRSFQGGPDQTAITKTLDAFRVQVRGSGFPRKGTVLLCSSDHKTPSLLLPDESCTMFSHALLDVLKNGDPHLSPQLSLHEIKELVQDRLSMLPARNAPRPSLHSPDQSEGDVADVPLFPNTKRNKVLSLSSKNLSLSSPIQAMLVPPSISISNPVSGESSPAQQSQTAVRISPPVAPSPQVSASSSGATPAAKVRPGKPGKSYRSALLVGAIASIFSIIITSAIIYSVNPSFGLLPPLGMSLITGFIIGKRGGVRLAGLFSGLVVGVSWFALTLALQVDDVVIPLACAATCGLLSWLVAWLITRTHPEYLSSGSQSQER
jgi:Uncharacterized protein containing caspase domain